MFAFLVLLFITPAIAVEDLVPVRDPISDRILDIRLPTVPVTVEPDMPAPTPLPVTPGTELISDLRSGELYVVAQDTQLRVYDSRRGIVDIRQLAGPVTFYFNKFADGIDRTVEETRTYKEKFVYVIRAVKAGEVELIISPVGSVDDSQDVRHVLTVNVGPRPPPGPVPPEPEPDDPDPPAPTPVTSFRVIFVKESGATLNIDQTPIPAAKVIRDYLDKKTTREGSSGGWREFDPHSTASNEPLGMKKLWEAVQPKLLPAPCLVVEVNGKATVMAFPRNVAETMETLKELGGE